jgi:hypothetical protein
LLPTMSPDFRQAEATIIKKDFGYRWFGRVYD